MPQVVVLISVGLHSFLTIQESRESVFETPRQILERGVSTFDRAGSKHNKTNRRVHADFKRQEHLCGIRLARFFLRTFVRDLPGLETFSSREVLHT